MQRALLIIASVVIFIFIIYYRNRRYYTASGLMVLFYLFGEYNAVFPYAKAYYAKWIIYVLFVGIWGAFNLLNSGRQKYIIYKVPLIFASLFIFSSLISALLSTNPGEASIRASTFILLVIIGYSIIPTDDGITRAWEIFIGIFTYDAIVILASVPGILHPGFYDSGRFMGILTRATEMTVYAYCCLIFCYEAVVTGRKNRGKYILLGMASLLIIILCKGRAGYLSALVGILVVTWACLPRTAFWVICAMLSLLLLFSAIVLKGTLNRIPTEEISSEVLRGTGTSLKEMSQIRWFYMQRAIHIFKQNPFFGIGMGTIPRGITVETNPDLPFQSSSQRVANQAGYHLLLAETGAIGLTFYLGWLFSSVYTYMRARKKFFQPRNIDTPSYFPAFLALFLAYAVNGIFEGYPSGAASAVVVRMWAISGIFALFASGELQQALPGTDQGFPGMIPAYHPATPEAVSQREPGWRSSGQI
jgi:hypothetical protein